MQVVLAAPISMLHCEIVKLICWVLCVVDASCASPLPLKLICLILCVVDASWASPLPLKLICRVLCAVDASCASPQPLPMQHCMTVIVKLIRQVLCATHLWPHWPWRCPGKRLPPTGTPPCPASCPVADRRSVQPQSFLHSAAERPKYTHKPERHNTREREAQYERKEGVCGLVAKSLTLASRAERPMYTHKPEREKEKRMWRLVREGRGSLWPSVYLLHRSVTPVAGSLTPASIKA